MGFALKSEEFMDKKLLHELLQEKKEKDYFDFKGTLKLYQADGKLVEKQRDELVKDILGLANGNSSIIRKTKRLIIGANDKQFDENGMRVLHSVDYKVPEQSELVKWLQSACSPAVVGISCELVPINGVKLFVITIPPTFDLHETKRELITPNAKFTHYTVFMRQDEHTVPASVREGVTIQQLKQLHRQEISNPPAGRIGAIAGGVVALIIGNAKITASSQADFESAGWIIQALFIVLGLFFGWVIGFSSKQWNEVRYDWRYMRLWQKIVFIGVMMIAVIIGSIFIK